MAKTASAPPEIDVVRLEKGRLIAWLVGETPLYFNRMAAKAKRELLLPRGRLTGTQKATKLKHAPLAEFVDSAYMRRRAGDVGATKLLMAGAAPKMAASGAALRMPSAVSKTEIKQLLSVPAEYCEVWGIPRLDMSVVRMAGISRTPDIRTRARVDRWAMRVCYEWVQPMLNGTKVETLIHAGGVVCGIGDWRIEKGGPNGGYRVAEEDDKELLDILASGGFDAQAAALEDAVCANDETEELMVWYTDELMRRGVKPEDERPEDVEVEDADPSVAMFGAGNEILEAPRSGVRALPMQNGAEHS